MTRAKIIDTFPFHDEFDILTMRLTELYDTVDHFIAVEADVTHQDRPKPYYLSENLDRFDEFKDKLIVVRASGLPTVEDDDDPWARELSQRAFVWDGLIGLPGIDENTIALHGDVDEIPRPLHVRNVRPTPGWFVSFEQRMHCFAIDWLHPDPWFGTVAARLSTVHGVGDHLNAWARVRDKRNRWSQPGSRVSPQPLPDAGWHFSWLGGREAGLKKVASFCHPEVADYMLTGLEDDRFYREGMHADGRKMSPCEVDDTYPRWIVEGHAPAVWFRPR